MNTRSTIRHARMRGRVANVFFNSLGPDHYTPKKTFSLYFHLGGSNAAMMTLRH